VAKGYLSLILHTHLPYVRHPEAEDFLEEDWLFEAITETYIPLIDVFRRLRAEGISFRLTMSLTPPLLSMLADPLLQSRYRRHLEQLIALARSEESRTRFDGSFHHLAQHYLDRFLRAKSIYDEYDSDLIRAFRQLEGPGGLELIASGATHGFLPLLGVNRTAAKAQIRLGVETHRHYLGSKPKGFWLPECGYNPGDDSLLAESGIRYFLLDSHGLLHATPRPRYATYAPIYCPSAVAAFGRDWESSKQVWSSQEGYPGDPEYREFYRDIGYDLDYDYVKPFLHSCGIRTQTGIKYYKITGPDSQKAPYNPQAATERAAVHAGNFMFNRIKQAEYLASKMDRPPIIVAPYDAELFGHWWYEGPQWLEFLLRKLHYDQTDIELITPGDYLELHPKNQIAQPTMSSWGYKGYNEVWLEGSNDWIYRHLHMAADRMTELADSGHADQLQRRALNQAARELLLAQSSDWAFIMKTGTMVSYAVRRTHQHIHNFTGLYEQIKANRLDESWLAHLEKTNNIFPFLDYTIYKSQGQAALSPVV
jgi:1,4-alpha-glucan branching enzyme